MTFPKCNLKTNRLLYKSFLKCICIRKQWLVWETTIPIIQKLAVASKAQVNKLVIYYRIEYVNLFVFYFCCSMTFCVWKVWVCTNWNKWHLLRSHLQVGYLIYIITLHRVCWHYIIQTQGWRQDSGHFIEQLHVPVYPTGQLELWSRCKKVNRSQIHPESKTGVEKPAEW